MRIYDTQLQRRSRTLEISHKNRKMPLELILQKYNKNNDNHTVLSNIMPIQRKAYLMSRPLESYRHSFRNTGEREFTRKAGSYIDAFVQGGIGIGERVLNKLHRFSLIPRHWYIKFDSTHYFWGMIDKNTDNVGVDNNGYITNEPYNDEAFKLETISKDGEDDYLVESICEVKKGTYNAFSNNCRHWVKKVIANFNATKQSNISGNIPIIGNEDDYSSDSFTHKSLANRERGNNLALL